MKQLIEQQREDFEKKFKIFEQVAPDEVDGTFAIEHDKEKVWNWHKQSLKQFIDELIAENEHQDGKLYGFDIIVTEKETPTNDYIEGYKQGFKIKKKTIYDHLKKLKEELN